ncbi:HAD-IA family hydrolase [Streptomyces sp. NBC_00424]|uniref:HAD-IA family hydrolase n=1 Tax=Streptomyces sp. NBC_00424 TaxID=2903648 RepID=UPI002250C0CC|nr:HAD-IA family hydrolase [Streptomyces sp. NBC_00424]MCX5077700.1 HAD-IA family hydrolase [Streptomyces sp. NBC_00424]
MTTTLHAALFDVDGVLINSGAAHNRVWTSWEILRGLDPKYVRQVTQGKRRLDTLRIVGPDLDVAEENRVLDRLMATEEEAMRPYPDAADVLHALTMPWAVVTSSRREATRLRMERLGLPVPRVRVCAEDVQSGKPSPDGYLAAAEQLGVDPRRCVVVEDSPAGIQAGRAAGCTVYAVTTTHGVELLAEADACFPSLDRAAQAIKETL